ncbi:CvpA family protein [Mycoplasma zalophidermidis]|uniref:CvpA family protein n=1 Tax=Mycoplasma zalophidermidis TaxID=398174 RepID=UPI00215CA625|nr:CvpA family protein [Mycoplasma zalophidermidis]MCR8966274.1 CvpA family protein [Mycoplasma zalophidermidis]
METLNNYFEPVKNIFSSADKPTMGLLPITIFIIFCLIAALWGYFKGVWSAITMLILTIIGAVIAFAIAPKIHWVEKIIDISKEPYSNYKEEIMAIIAGLNLFVILALIQIIALIMTEISMKISKLTTRQLKKRNKKTLLVKTLGLVVAPLSALPFASATVNISGIFGYNNRPIEMNDALLEKLSQGKIKGLSRYLPLVTTAIKISMEKENIQNISNISQTFTKSPSADYNKETNTLTITPFSKEPTPEQIQSFNSTTTLISTILDGTSKTEESYNVFVKSIGHVPVDEEQKQQAKQALNDFIKKVKDEGIDPTKTKVNLNLISNDLKPIVANLTKEQKTKVITELTNHFLGSADEETTAIAVGLLDSLIINPNVAA